MTTYVSRLVSVDARQFHGGVSNATPLMEWINGNGGKAVWCGALPPRYRLDGHMTHPGLPESLRIKTQDGWLMAHAGDYIIRHPKGYFYPYNQEDFEELYVEDSNHG